MKRYTLIAAAACMLSPLAACNDGAPVDTEKPAEVLTEPAPRDGIDTRRELENLREYQEEMQERARNTEDY